MSRTTKSYGTKKHWQPNRVRTGGTPSGKRRSSTPKNYGKIVSAHWGNAAAPVAKKPWML